MQFWGFLCLLFFPVLVLLLVPFLDRSQISDGPGLVCGSGPKQKLVLVLGRGPVISRVPALVLVKMSGFVTQ